jgi:hypothetical protein
MKVTIKEAKYDVVFNYTALKKIQELTNTKIFDIGNLDALENAPIYLASGIFGGAKIKDSNLTEMPISVKECEDYFNQNLSAFYEVSMEMNKSLTNAFAPKHDKGAK